jgi:predicted ATPase/class 3 adenylate cyclase
MDSPSEIDLGTNLASLVRMSPPFVGRQQEFDWLIRGLAEAMGGQPRLVLMPGEAGIGKTRLLLEVQAQARRRGVQVGLGRCYEDLTFPYLPFVGAWRMLLEQVPPDVARALGSDLKVIRRLVRQDATPAHAAHALTAAEADQDTLALVLGVSRATIKLAQHCPTLFIVDDLHWADRSSLDLFGHLVFTVADMAGREPVPLLIIATYRSPEPETRMARLLARLEREHLCQTLTLPGLDESEVRQLIRGLGLVRPSQQLTATVSAATRGNPLFIQEVLRHLVKQDALQRRGGYLVTTTAPADLQLPEHVMGALILRTQGLSKGCRTILKLASFLGERFAPQVLCALSGKSEDELLELLEEGVRQHILLSDGPLFQFAHPLIRHIFYTDPSAARRQRIHLQIAQTLQRLYADRPDAHLLDIAHHLVRAGRAADPDTVATSARRAGDQAFGVFAWGDAASYYEAALAAIESSGRLSVHDRAELHYWAGRARHRDQDVGPCLAHYEQAAEAYRQAHDVRGLARVLMERAEIQYTLASVPLGTLPDMQPLEDILAALGEGEPALRGQILAIMAQVYRNARQGDKAEAIARRALEIGQRLGDHHLSARASSALALAHLNDGRIKEALESYRSAFVYARRTDDLWLQGWPLQRMPLPLIVLGQLAEAEQVALEACALSRTTHDWGDHSVASSHLTSIAVVKGQFEATERQAHETVLMVYRSGYFWGGVRALFALACARALRGAWAEAEDALDMLVHPEQAFHEAGPTFHIFAQAFRRLIRTYAGTVEPDIEPFATELLRVVRSDTYSLAPLCALVELGDHMRAPQLVESATQALSQAAARGVVFSSGWMFLIPRILGIAAMLNRQWETAENHFHQAIEVGTGAGARPELGRSYLDYARLLVSRRRKGDRQRAAELVEQASRIFAELSMEPFIQRAAQLIKPRRPRPSLPQRRSIATPKRLSAMEVEVLLQRTQGRTDQEIAMALMLSPRTVARHVSTLSTRVGVSGREDAATYAREQGLSSQVAPQRWAVPTPTHRHAASGVAAQPLLTVLITDMEGSTALIDRVGDVQAYELLRIHNALIRDCLRTYEGTEVTHTGDGIEASFRLASKAVECAIAIQQAFAQYNAEHPTTTIRVRVGINAGEPITTEGRLFGTSVHAAFRICTRAQPGQILISDVVRQLVAGHSFVFADRGRVPLRGFRGRAQLYEVQWDDARE